MYLSIILSDISPFDWQRLWLSDEAPLTFLLEVVFRSVFAYLLTILALRVSGKRGVRQLSLFEFSLLLALGSAAGDAMFYHDVPLLHVVVVFGVVILLYVLFNHFTDKYPRVERLFEGEPDLIIAEGEINLPAFRKQSLTPQELFGQLRQYQVEHLGQVRRLYLEATGEISVFFYAPEQVRPGLPILPEELDRPLVVLPVAGAYACHACGVVRKLPAGPAPAPCPRCAQRRGWLRACDAARIQ